MIFRSHRYMVAMFVIFHDLSIINLESLNFKKVISICNNIIVQAFKPTLRINIHF